LRNVALVEKSVLCPQLCPDLDFRVLRARGASQ